ncbi:hypothetical protein [Nocardia jinanensis]|uniref:Uncharacterized protein n=1 Tax=Nocardia jinanensis TaxID=382504 RepID=A0A917VSC0_9NOCA|nr:hypothetical protein [Nocardia jinanensis]GGL13819.1 hypothetical protein GCM10011588_30330 [Nocardia jinanensis]
MCIGLLHSAGVRSAIRPSSFSPSWSRGGLDQLGDRLGFADIALIQDRPAPVLADQLCCLPDGGLIVASVAPSALAMAIASSGSVAVPGAAYVST